jgi:hypothetical protein
MDEALGLGFRWDDGVKHIKRINAKLNVGVARFKKESRYSQVVPGTYNMARIAQGHPRPVVRQYESDIARKGKGKVVSIVINCVASWNVKAEQLHRRGAAALAIVQALETQGRRCEITVVSKTTSGWGKNADSGEFRVTVKRPNEVLNLPSIAFACAHPSMLRRFVFAAMEREGKEYRDAIVENGYGTPADTDDAQRKDTIYFGKMLGSENEWKSDDDALAHVIKILTEQGIIID